jgi:hypothetical protein
LLKIRRWEEGRGYESPFEIQNDREFCTHLQGRAARIDLKSEDGCGFYFPISIEALS